MSIENSNGSIGDKTSNLVAQCINQLRHRLVLLRQFKDLSVYGRFEGRGLVWAWNELMWLEIGTSGGLL